MYELIQISEHDYYIENPNKIGLVRLTDTDVCLIDSGIDKDVGRKVRQILDANGWRLRAIYNTHCHADHIGGNKYLQSQTGCAVYLPEIECDFACHPILEPSLLYGGYPPKELHHKFLLAQESDAQVLTNDALPAGFEVVELPGHFFNMVGFRTPDDTLYLADCLSSQRTLEKYQISFLYDVAAYLDTLEQVKGMTAKTFVPAHAEATADIAPLAQYNIDKVHEIAELIVTFCKTPLTFEEILQKLFAHYDLTMTFEQYALVGSTVRSYLSWLKDTGRLDVEIADHMLRFRS